MHNYVPVIDISQPLTAASRARLDTACRDHGFFLLSGHGLDPLIHDMWRVTEAFFLQDPATKREVQRSEKNALGFYDRELTKRKRDQKEVFDFIGPREPEVNRWPTTPAAFQPTMVRFFEAFSDLSLRTLALVYNALELPEDTIAAHGGEPRTSNVRLNYYPVDDSLDAYERATVTPLGDMALHHHTDPGILTLLLQDDTGGLQCQSSAHGWIDVPPTPGTIVVNLGDTLQVWSNDAYKAAIHRVVHMTHRARYSTPYFLNPKPDATLAPIAELTRDTPPRYRPFGWKEFITGRMNDNYADLGEDDIQISHYRIAS